MDCSGVIAKLSSYVDGALDEHTLEMIEAHLAACPECRRELAALQVMVAAAGEIEPAQPPGDLKHRILSSVRRAQAEDRRCAGVAGLLSAYVDGELSPRQAELVEAHASACEACAREISAIRMLVGAAGGVAPIEPPADLRARIAAAVARQRAQKIFSARLIGRIRTFVPTPMARLAYAGAAAVLVAFGLLTLSPRAPEPATTPAVNRPAAAPAMTADVTEPKTEAPAPRITLAQPGKETASIAPARAVRHRVRHRAMMAAAGRSTGPKPAPKPTVHVTRPEPADLNKTRPEVTNVAADNEPKPIEVADAPPPPPDMKPVARKPDRPTAIKVAAAPLISADRVQEMMKEIKAEAAMRRNTGRIASVAIFRSRF